MPRLQIIAGSRLHLGQLDLNGSLGRLYGGLGLAIAEPRLRLTARRQERLTVEAADAQDSARLRELAQAYLACYNLPGLAVTLEEALPSHSGLGSGSQLALALGLAVRQLYDLQVPLRELAAVTDRESSRSGIGVAAFAEGGFVVDGGKALAPPTSEQGDKAQFEVPPLIARLPFPAHWRVILALPEQDQSKIYGPAEAQAFASLPPMPERTSGLLCRYLLLNVLPALQLADLPLFGRAVQSIQETIGDYFAPAQGGRYRPGLCTDLVAFLRGAGAVGVGQSSWGPTIYGFVEESAAEALAERTRAFLGRRGRVWLTQGCNEGASWHWLDD